MDVKEVWSVIEALDGRPHETALQMASEARRVGRALGATACCVVADHLDDSDAVLDDLCRHGIEKVYLVDARSAKTGCGAEPGAERLVPLVREHVPEVVLFAATREGTDQAARLAARLRAGLIANCVEFDLLDDVFIARRPVVGGKAHATVAWAPGQPCIATVNLGSLDAVTEGVEAGASVEVVRIAAAAMCAPAAVSIRRWRLAPAELDLTEAAFVIGVGRPVDTPESLERVQLLADRLGATLGGSRIAHFQGVIPKSRQIGASGRWISPEVYLALGISGASYHVMGIKGAKHIVAVNTDRDAPIFRLAELGIVADLEDIVGALLAVIGVGSSIEDAKMTVS